MRKTLSFFIILALIGSLLAMCITVQGLNEVVDDYLNSNYLGFMNDVHLNASLGVIELDWDPTLPLLENYSVYTEIDANNRFAVTDNTIVVESLSNKDDHHRVVFDYGQGYFTDFTHDLEARARDNSGGAGNDRMFVWMLANVSDEPQDIQDAGGSFISLYFTEFDNSDPNPPEIRLYEISGGGGWMDRWDPGPVLDTWYFFRIVKTGANLFCGIYSTANLRDAGDGTDGDLDNLFLALQHNYNFRWIYAVSSYSNGFASTRLISGDIKNLYIGRTTGAFQPDGYFYTQNMMDGTNYSLALLTTTTLNTGTITVELSPDNSTWYNHENVSGAFETLEDGYDGFDMRDNNFSLVYLRYNFTLNGPLTPWLNQTILYHTGDPPGGGVGPGTTTTITVTEDEVPYIALAIMMVMCIALIFDRARK